MGQVNSNETKDLSGEADDQQSQHMAAERESRVLKIIPVE